MTLDTPQIADPSDRWRAKRERILDAADELISSRGLKGLTFGAVGEAVGLNTTSITYYFKRKEQLAAAALDRAVQRLDDMAEAAGRAPDPRARVAAFIDLRLERERRVRAGEDRHIAILSEIRALDDPLRQQLIDRYKAMRARAAAFFAPGPFDPAALPEAPPRAVACAQVLLDVTHWMRAWLHHYPTEDFERVRERMVELLADGLAAPGGAWAPRPLVIDPPEQSGPSGEPGPEAFLRAATVLVNVRGYRGASVERIAAQLNVSKGSFYHHLEGKDDLVMNCFARSYERVARAQTLAMERPGDGWRRLADCVGALLAQQFAAEFPLLRITALHALPIDLRVQALRGADRMARRYAGMISDGIADGSIRPVDPMIASQCLAVMINGAWDVHAWAQALPMSRAEAIALYASVLAFGMFPQQG
ncbi:TetR/AcrR family transcriptional regulator [Albimonas pacifica]|uniref:Transcriptional regulator, TetR family n=1 Tax=Albimonas pacifica TaxID=1114924 RepID=A0A1I3NEN8_9RHOB|nr:TetR/AcrR family transcriptional regulator [Albimonas pacifica]SFJ07246.1 transcriptional regulator, TetR family [Albimonas pacifica]